MKYLLLFIFSLIYICSNGQYSKIAELLSPQNDTTEKNVIIDSFLNADNYKYYYLYGLQNQPDCIEIVKLLAQIRSENNYDSIAYLEKIFLNYLPIHRLNWNQPYSEMGFRYERFMELLIAFRMTFLDAGMNLLNWNITQKFAYLKSQEVDGWFENRVNTQSLEKLLFKDGKKPEWYVEFDSSQLYRISALDSIKSFFSVLFQNNYNQFLTIESYKLMEEQFPMYAECIYSEMESQNFFDNSNFIGKRGFEFNLLKIISKNTSELDTNRLNKIFVKNFKKFMEGGIYFRTIFIKFANEELVDEYCKEITNDCNNDKWTFLSFSSNSLREMYLNNRIGVYLLKNSDSIPCKLIGLNKIIYIDSATRGNLKKILKNEKNKLIRNMILKKLG